MDRDTRVERECITKANNWLSFCFLGCLTRTISLKSNQLGYEKKRESEREREMKRARQQSKWGTNESFLSI